MTRPRRRSDPNAPNARSLARTAAVQALYQMDMAGTGIDDVIVEFSSHAFAADEEPSGESTAAGGPSGTAGAAMLTGADATFFAEILRGVVRRQRDIDPMVDQALAAGWRLVRVDSILRAILRAGVFELMERPDVPPRVVINEYINVAHAFFAEDEPRVVNGILDKLARQLRPAAFEGRGPGNKGSEPEPDGGAAHG